MFDSPALSTRFYYFAFALLSAIGFLAPIRVGDLPGYDDARYTVVAKTIVQTGEWLDLRHNGVPDFEHPPLLEWTQAAFFSVFGVSDFVAKLPSALFGWGTVLLVGWLGRRLTGDDLQGVLSMFALASSAYFVKYTARAMTDVPVTFFFVAALCAWSMIEDDPRWYLAAGAFTALALMTRGLIGFALPAVFFLDLLLRRQRPNWIYAVLGLALALAPLALWYARLIHVYGQQFLIGHASWLDHEVYGPLSPPWRRYTGIPKYLFMLVKSYWPWLPFTVAGMVATVRSRQRKFYVLVILFVVVLILAGAARSRVLRYLLPVYPAFSILAAVGLTGLIPVRFIKRGLLAATPLLAVAVLAIAIFPPVGHHASETRPLALAATSVTPAGDRIAFYDDGKPLYDETNQILWYGERNLTVLLSPEDLEGALQARQMRVFVLDQDTYHKRFDAKVPLEVVAQSGHLICVRLTL